MELELCGGWNGVGGLEVLGGYIYRFEVVFVGLGRVFVFVRKECICFVCFCLGGVFGLFVVVFEFLGMIFFGVGRRVGF